MNSIKIEIGLNENAYISVKATNAEYIKKKTEKINASKFMTRVAVDDFRIFVCCFPAAYPSHSSWPHEFTEMK